MRLAQPPAFWLLKAITSLSFAQFPALTVMRKSHHPTVCSVIVYSRVFPAFIFPSRSPALLPSFISLRFFHPSDIAASVAHNAFTTLYHLSLFGGKETSSQQQTSPLGHGSVLTSSRSISQNPSIPRWSSSFRSSSLTAFRQAGASTAANQHVDTSAQTALGSREPPSRATDRASDLTSAAT